MNQEERNLLQGLFDRLRTASGEPRDGEAERYIAERIREQPYAPYFLAQAVLMQEPTMQAASQRIAELESRVQELESAQRPSQGGFLAGRTGGLFSGGGRSDPPPQQRSSASVPPTGGPWGRGPVMAQPQQPQPQPQPSYQPPMQPAPQASSGGGFLRGALASAAGVVGGAVLYDQLKGMFGGHGGAAQASGLPGYDQRENDRILDDAQDEMIAEQDQDDQDQDAEQDASYDNDSNGDIET